MSITVADQVRQWIGDKNPHDVKGSDFPGWHKYNRETINSSVRRMRSEWDREHDQSVRPSVVNAHVPAMTTRAQDKVAQLVAAGTCPQGARQMVRQWWPEAMI